MQWKSAVAVISAHYQPTIKWREPNRQQKIQPNNVAACNKTLRYNMTIPKASNSQYHIFLRTMKNDSGGFTALDFNLDNLPAALQVCFFFFLLFTTRSYLYCTLSLCRPWDFCTMDANLSPAQPSSTKSGNSTHLLHHQFTQHVTKRCLVRFHKPILRCHQVCVSPHRANKARTSLPLCSIEMESTNTL